MVTYRAIALFMVSHSVVALVIGIACSYAFMFMPDGTGSVMSISAERAALLVASEGKLAQVLAKDPRRRLEGCTHHARGEVLGAESIVVAPNGSLLALDRTGVLFRVDASLARSGRLGAHAVGYVGPGRPLGYHLTDSEHLLICDSLKGLLDLHLPSGELRLLYNAISYANDLDVAPAPREAVAHYGKVYFTSSTREPVELARPPHGRPFYDTMNAYLRCMLRGDASGALLEFDPATAQARPLLSGLWFANGVALSASADYVLVVETLGFRVHRVWLSGERAGTSDIFASALPGFPDGITRSADGAHFFLAIIAPWSPLLKALRYRLVRGMLARVLPLTLRFVKRLGLVLKLRASDGAIVDVYSDPTGSHVASVSAVSERHSIDAEGRARGSLLLGQLQGDTIPECML
mmetsp:Transcript_9458/g.24522  ORF Transcript_9458/g.24522 Transcript_9458/m.24522 type:complete len:408 (-) Transcript_9458:92-1315(-)